MYMLCIYECKTILICYISVVKCEIVRMGGGKLSGTFTSVVISLGIAACLSICTFAA